MATVVPYALVAVLGVVLMLVIAVLAFRRRPTPGAMTLAVLAFGIAIWSLTTLLEALGGYELARQAARASYVGVTLTVLSWFVLTVDYTGRERYLSRPLLGLLCVEPIVVNALVWTNESHRLFWRSTGVGGPIYSFEVVHGPAFWLHVAYSYLLVVVGTGLIVAQLYRSQSVYRGQSAAMLLGVAVPLVGNALWLSGQTALDWTPIAFVVTASVFYWSMLNYEFIDLAPVARDTVLDRIPSGVVVLGPDGRITDANEKMEEFLDAELDELLGEDVEKALARWPQVTARAASEVTKETTLEVAEGERHFSVEIERFVDDWGRYAGQIVLVHDVTERKRREQELERQNEQLDRFADVLTHDLRNPLNVAEGNLKLAGETDDGEYLDNVRSAHERMNDLIDDVRTLVKHGQTISEVERLDLTAVARNAASNVDTRAAEVRIGDALGTVEADESRLLHAFENLFRNAIEHGTTPPTSADDPDTGQPTPDGGDGRDHGPDRGEREGVTITVGRIDGASADRAGFYVADDGPGIPPDVREKIFESGYTTSDDGTGLGLAIVQNAIEAHGWRIEVSESEEGGARFEVTGVSFADD